MKTYTIRFRFFMWLAIHTAIVFVTIGLTLYTFDFLETLHNPAQRQEELEEVLVVTGVMIALFPLGLVGAWLISRRLLRPWRNLVDQAEAISAGRLEDRIEVRNAEDEIGRLAGMLNQTFDRYQLLMDRLERFNYDASHQLRNPLAAIRAHAEVCLKSERSVEEYREVMAAVLEDADRLNRTVNQLLMLARSAGGGVADFTAKVDLHAVVEEVVREGNIVGEMRSVTVTLSAPVGPVEIFGDRDLLREAVANLMDNALKHSPEHEVISVLLKRQSSGSVRLSISDAGPGLSSERKALVFRPFEKAKNSGKESVGLGLAIVADICRAHGARFGVDRSDRGGSCFWIEFSPGPQDQIPSP